MIRSKFSSLPISGLIVACLLLTGATLNAGNLTLTFDAGNYRTVEMPDGRQLIEMEGFQYMLEPGKPMLPANTFMVAIPPGAEVTSVSFQPIGTTELSGTFRIRPADAYMPDNDDLKMMEKCRQTWQDNYNAVYKNDAPYPAESGIFGGTGGLRKYALAKVTYCPFSFHPQSGKLEFTPSVDVTIEYAEGSTDDPRMQKIMRDTRADKVAAEMVVNFDEAQSWYEVPTSPATNSLAYRYLVIYGDGLDVPAQAIVSGMQLDGDGVIESASYIKTNYTGSDDVEKIRNYLIEKYAEWGIEYLLIMGDISQIPMRMCFPDPTYHYPGSDYCPPTDYYYADLTGDWDSDGDGYYGEYGEDNVDFIPELQVGRIPYNDSLTVHTIVDKLIDFQFDQDPWKNNALLLGAMQNYADEDRSGYLRTDGADLMEHMISDMLGGFTYVTEYEKGGLNPSTYACDYPINNTNAVGEWATGQYGIVNWWGHGSRYASYRKYWNSDDGDGVPESSEILWEAFLGTGDVSSLDDSHSSIIFSCSCNNGWPESNNLAKNLLRRGSAGIVASTRVSWYSVGWSDPSWGGNAAMDYFFYDYLINGPEDVGTALNSSRLYYYGNFMWWGWASAQNLYNFCLYGDPQIVREGKEGGCCDLRGDFNNDGARDILDLDDFIGWLYRGDPPAVCPEEADVDGNDNLDILDIDYFIGWLYREEPLPVPCP